MIEDEWLSCTDPRPMLEFLRDSGRANDGGSPSSNDGGIEGTKP